jgi:ribosome-binding factor A
MAQARTQRIESEIQRVLAGLVARELKDPRVGNITITAVSAAGDMGSVRVFFTPFASSHPPQEVCRALNHAAGFLRGELGRRLALRYAPRLEFVHDESVDGAARLSRLIDRAVAGDHAHEGGAAGGADRDAGRAEPGGSGVGPGAVVAGPHKDGDRASARGRAAHRSKSRRR